MLWTMACVLVQDGYVHNADSQQVSLKGDGMRDAISKTKKANRDACCHWLLSDG